ncbi:MAG TPA: endo-1,4-beta-xylanase [Terracidiphilus sp.]|jgi:endo-1,4-beta-xylanase
MQGTGTLRWTRRRLGKTALALGAAGALPAWLRGDPGELNSTPMVGGADSLRAHAAARGLLYGAAVNPALLDVDGAGAGTSADGYTQLVQAQTNILVAENAMKWKGLRPTAAGFDFAQADRLMRFAALTGDKVRGHNLCWHEALPDWFAGTVTKDNARRILTEHIQTVAGRYRGQIHSWDVVNEAIDPKSGRADGLRASPWLGLVGPEYVEVAFQTAAAADPAARLTYNDYDIELDTAEQAEKRGQVMMLLRRLKARQVPLHAVGIQSHLKADGPQPGAGLQAFLREAGQMGLAVYVTELDVNTFRLEGGPAAQDAAVARVYRDYLGMVLAEPNVEAVLTWGITSAHTWLNESKQPWAQRADGARQRPLPFDDGLQPTPAFGALRNAMDTARTVAPAPGTAPAPAADPNNLYKPFPVPGSPPAAPPTDRD